MSTPKYITNCLFLIIIVLCNLTHNIDGVPLPKAVLNSTRKAFRNVMKIQGTQKVTTKPIIRKPRFFGKFSFLAGLGLPEAASPTITRNDILLDDRSAAQYSVSYNFPPRKWGPYIAAVYEPLPILSFFQNPWAYIADFLNPFNWFSSSTTRPNTAINPDHLVVQSVTPDKSHDGDVLVLVEDSDNEISNIDRNSVINKLEIKMKKENFNNPRLQSSVNTEGSILLTKRNDLTTNFVTMVNDVESKDLIAEETTIKEFAEIKIDDELENINLKANTRKMKKHNVTTTSTTKAMTTKTVSNNTTINPETTTNHSNNTLNTADQALIPQKNSSNANDHNKTGYYYHGNPQNISHVEFTSQATPNTFHPIKYHNFNEVNQFLQQFPTTYYDSYGFPIQERYDQLNHFEQKPPKVNDYYSRNIEFVPNNGNNFMLNGFKPSFPFHL